MHYVLKCYISNKLVYNIDVYMRPEIFIKQLKNKILCFDTAKGGSQVFYLDNFDRIDVSSQLYELFIREEDSNEVGEVQEVEEE